eukprot:CCRYP_008796-RB/>CCRYP_008796-RB protein AED:0.33 eAED:0.33 QI:434/1/1/1/1/1/3/141/677
MPSFYKIQRIALVASFPVILCSSLQIHTHRRHKSLWNPIHCHQFTRHISPSTTALYSTTDEETHDDETLLQSIDISTLQNLCTQYSLSTTGTKQELLQRLRDYANRQAELDAIRRLGRKERVESNLEGKSRHTFVEEDAFYPYKEADEEDSGYFYYSAPESDEDKKKKKKEEEERIQKQKQFQAMRSPHHITAPPPPKEIEPNEKGERVVTIYSTTDNNDLTSMTNSEMSMDDIYQKSSLGTNRSPEDSLIGGPFGDTSGSRRKKEDESQLEKAKENLRELVGNLLATTGAPAFQEDYEEENGSESNPFETPYGFVGFQPERIPPNLLVESSYALRMQNGKALKEVLSEYELQAIGHDGMAADNVSKGGGHYREVEKVRSFLEGFRKSEERRIARETSTMLLERLVKEGVSGLDQMLASMPKEGGDSSYMLGVNGGEAGELNTALVRYLEEAIREQEQRVGKVQIRDRKERLGDTNSLGEEEENDIVWNVTRGEDGTTIETIDLSDPLLREELERTKAKLPQYNADDNLSSMTVQEKMLLLLKLLRDRVKVEAVMGNHSQARNLRILAYCLKARSDDERRKFILDELGMSLDALDVFFDLVTSSIDYTEARTNDGFSFMPGQSPKTALSPLLNLTKLRAIKELVVELKASQQWKASGVSRKAQAASPDDNRMIDELM